jgi:hypothetical protein
MKNWSAWFPDVLVHVSGAPDPLVSHALCRASREFFRRTRAWMQWLDPVASRAGEGVTYDFDLPRGAQKVRIERATVGWRPLAIESFREVDRDCLAQPQGERALVSQDLQAFSLVGLFAAGEVVQVQASLMPTPDAKGLPDDLADRYLELIAEGAKAILMLTPDTEFYRPDLAAVSRAAFERGIGIASLDAYQGHTNNVPRARVKWC